MQLKQPSSPITFLNSMASKDIEEALQIYKNLGLTWVDLKDSIYGKALLDLGVEEARKLKACLKELRLEVHCLSSQLFSEDLAKGAQKFEEQFFEKIPHALVLTQILQPTYFRFLPPTVENPEEWEIRFPWFFPLLQRAIDLFSQKKIPILIENEVHDSVISSPESILSFFEHLRGAGLIWDIGNSWQCGYFPSVEDFHRLKPLIHMVHLKGGKGKGSKYKWKGQLSECPWPVLDILHAAAEEGISPVLCLNPPHGEIPPGSPPKSAFQYAKEDLDWLRLKGLVKLPALESTH